MMTKLPGVRSLFCAKSWSLTTWACWRFIRAPDTCLLLNQMPLELLELVAAHLTTKELTCMIRTCKALCRCFNQRLWALESSQDTALFWACTYGSEEMVKKVYALGRSLAPAFRCPDPDSLDKANWAAPLLSPLNTAIFNNQPGISRFLIRHGADVNLPDDCGLVDQRWNCLHIKAPRERILLHPINGLLTLIADKKNKGHWKSLKWVYLVFMLLERGADPNQADELGGRSRPLRPLCLATCEGVSAEVVRVLLERGADQMLQGSAPLCRPHLWGTPMGIILVQSRQPGPVDPELLLKFRYLLQHWLKSKHTPVRVNGKALVYSLIWPSQGQLEILKIAIQYKYCLGGTSLVEGGTALASLKEKLEILKEDYYGERRCGSTVLLELECGEEMMKIIKKIFKKKGYRV
ncbi:hypothetical protein BJ170DRAFT_624141 [Xylariales sp. AK1849]|nr:hypothetical protein BJ170DRAFT_624141 [Xylariales sp. AK1849]